MQNIFDIHDYDENFLERFASQTIPIYDLWSIRPLQNEQKELIAGSSDEADKFRSFIHDHSNQEFPHPLVIIVGNAEKNNPKIMLNMSKRYFKIKFDKFKGTDIGMPLTIAGAPEPYPTNQTPPFAFNGLNTSPQNPLQGFSLGDIHGIIDRNVADATRSIKAEYEEQAARREAENIKRLAELETRMEMYKLEMRAKEVENREQELRRELEELERKRAEGLGTVKDYTKTIAGGLFELGKSAFGIDTKDDDEPINETKTTTKTDLGTTSIIDDNDDGFSEVKNEELKTEDDKPDLDIILNGIANLDEEQKMALLDALLPEEDGVQKLDVREQKAEGREQKAEENIEKSELETKNINKNEDL